MFLNPYHNKILDTNYKTSHYVYKKDNSIYKTIHYIYKRRNRINKPITYTPKKTTYIFQNEQKLKQLPLY